jgi:3-isopropylmalate/(R)-2-methylmalate dehydratase small subunit
MMNLADASDSPQMNIDIAKRHVTFGGEQADFDISARHQSMFLQGVDVIGLTLTYKDDIEAFQRSHWEQQPWIHDVSRRMKERLTHHI